MGAAQSEYEYDYVRVCTGCKQVKQYGVSRCDMCFKKGSIFCVLGVLCLLLIIIQQKMHSQEAPKVLMVVVAGIYLLTCLYFCCKSRITDGIIDGSKIRYDN